MALYRYNARDRENRKYKGVKEAGSEAELVKALLEDGLYCCSLKNEERTASMKHFTVPFKAASSFVQPGQFHAGGRCSSGGDLKNSL